VKRINDFISLILQIPQDNKSGNRFGVGDGESIHRENPSSGKIYLNESAFDLTACRLFSTQMFVK
jgi:hypothetical protein